VLYRAELLPERWPLRGSRYYPLLTDRVGFEPTRAINPTRFPIVLLKPLGHLSSCPRARLACDPPIPSCPRAPSGVRPANSFQRRGWDSNPREPFGLDGLANRCRNHLATSPDLLLNCPSWARTRTLLIQSQTCCQLHQGAPFRGSSPRPRPTLLLSRSCGITAERETGFEPATLSLGS
jgi:hypothetical protein